MRIVVPALSVIVKPAAAPPSVTVSISLTFVTVGSALTTSAFTPTFATFIACAISSSVVLLPPILVT